jgi:GntR family transcriptional regulator
MPRRLSSNEIAYDLIERIEAGEYAPGARLPSYSEIAKLYDVGISTAQRVILILRTSGVVRTEPGRGTYVAEPDDAE